MSTPAAAPLTRISPETEISLEAMAARVVKTRELHGELLQQYHKVWYESDHTWVYTHFLGVGVMKCPNDLWMYQALIAEHRPTTIIETGTYQGGTALWFAFVLDMLGIDGRVYTIDYEDRRKCSHPRITFLDGDSTNPELVAALAAQLPDAGPRLISLDADHSAAHVRRELDLYAPLCRVGDWLVVEDTNVAWLDGHTVEYWEAYDGSAPHHLCRCGYRWDCVRAADPLPRCPNDRGDRGARGGLEDYLRAHPGEWRQDVLCERYLMTCHPGGWLQRMGDYAAIQ